MAQRGFALALLALLATGGGVPAQTPGASPPDSEAGCLAAGGRWARGGLSPRPLCFLPTADAGKACSRASDCESACLAETRTCAAEKPLFGCYGYLDDTGREVTICAD